MKWYMYNIIVILLKYFYEWCIWYTLDWAAFKGSVMGIAIWFLFHFEQVTWILETAQAFGLSTCIPF